MEGSYEMTYYNISIDKIRSKYIYKNIYSQKTKSVLYKKLSKYVFEDQQTTYNCILLIVMEKILNNRFMIINIKGDFHYAKLTLRIIIVYFCESIF